MPINNDQISMKKLKKPELLSPAGSLEKLKTAILFGADAVYAGVPDFSLRSRINDFSWEKLAEGAEFVHKNGKKIYGTLNIYAHNKHLEKAEEAIKKYQDAGVDAIILSDPGVLDLAKKIAHGIPLHLSTQANCTNWQAADFWKKQGISRIILARELALEEIREIHRQVPDVELECFVHGAMCMAYSGRCILSKFLSQRSANQGLCSQPCRWAYNVSPAGENENLQKKLEIEEDRHGTYLLNSEDLCLIEHLEKLKEAGVSSFKIEGRTKSIYYAAAATRLYRQTIDLGKPPENFKEELEKLANRGYTSGFLFGEEKCGHNFSDSHEKCRWQFVGEVTDRGKDYIKIKAHNEIFADEEIEFISPGISGVEKIKAANMRDGETGEDLTEIHGGQGKEAIIKTDKNIKTGSVGRKLLSDL